MSADEALCVIREAGVVGERACEAYSVLSKLVERCAPRDGDPLTQAEQEVLGLLLTEIRGVAKRGERLTIATDTYRTRTTEPPFTPYPGVDLKTLRLGYPAVSEGPTKIMIGA